jgi:hypothetical protein
MRSTEEKEKCLWCSDDDVDAILKIKLFYTEEKEKLCGGGGEREKGWASRERLRQEKKKATRCQSATSDRKRVGEGHSGTEKPEEGVVYMAHT